MQSANPTVSFVISTYNRRDVLLGTLKQVRACGLLREDFEVMVVDNASTDGTADVVKAEFPETRLFVLPTNRGSCAKNVAIKQAMGRYVVFLDDDSYPEPGSIARMIRRFEADPQLGAAVFTITLPDGSQECSAYPDVFIGCGTGFRAKALRQVGALPIDFFMQAEEYDLSLRLLDAGWNIRSFDDLHVAHLKTPTARVRWRTMRLDVRNNLIVARRYFPKQWKWRFARDWMKRYWKIAASKGQRTAFATGLIQGLMQSATELQPVEQETFNHFTRMGRIEEEMRKLEVKRVLFIDYGKNILPYWLAAKKLGMEVVGIADNRLRGSYRGIRILTDDAARQLRFDAAVISNSSPVHARQRARQWRATDLRRVVDLLAQTPTEALAHVINSLAA